jgi:exopolysaccharide biosynthesis polyprenyl glycosylphosphotransferase
LSQGTARRETHREHGTTQSRTRRGVLRLVRPLGVVALFEGPNRDANLRRDRLYRRALAVADAVAALAALECAIAFTGAAMRLRLPIVIALVVVAVVSAKLLGLYDRDELLLRKSTLDEGPAVFQLATLFALLVSISDWQLLGGELRSAQLLAVWLMTFCFTLLTRWCARHIGHRLTAAERCLVVGDKSGVEAVASRLTVGGGMNAVLIGRVDLGTEHERENAMHTLEKTILEDDIHRVILAPRASDSDVVLDVVRLVKSLGVKVSLLPRLFEVVGSSVVFDDVRGITLLGVRRFGLSRSSAAIKRAMDIAGSLVGLAALAPLIALIAVLIRLDSAGPIFFRQTRVGRDGERFSMLKFRSMVVGAEAMMSDLAASNGHSKSELFKLANDPRVTRVGRWLRSSAIDELPQLFNVLRGNMSLVGPRPLIIDEDALVQGWQRRRLHLTPGMTGPWQVLGSSAPLGEMVNMDYLYIANWSLFSDVKIMLRTALHVFGRRGS